MKLIKRSIPCNRKPFQRIKTIVSLKIASSHQKPATLIFYGYSVVIKSEQPSNCRTIKIQITDSKSTGRAHMSVSVSKQPAHMESFLISCTFFFHLSPLKRYDNF